MSLCLSNHLPVLPPGRARWSQRFCPSSGRVDAPIGGFRGTAASLPTTLSSVSSIQVSLCVLCVTQRYHVRVSGYATALHSAVVSSCSCRQQKLCSGRVSVSPQAREPSTGGEGRSCRCERETGVRDLLRRRVVSSCAPVCRSKATKSSGTSKLNEGRNDHRVPVEVLLLSLLLPVQMEIDR